MSQTATISEPLCPNCETGYAPGTVSCTHCGSALVVICSACGGENPVGFRFCGHCGTRLAGVTAEHRVGVSPVIPMMHNEAERRPLSVMFCDIVGSTELSVQLDPEDLRALIRTYQEHAATCVRRYGGYIAQYLGDGIMAYFGYPVAHEDAAYRAVHAGLDILEALRPGLEASGVRRKINVRIGIHTGLTVIGEALQGREPIAIGTTPNIAARLQSVATPGTIVISEDTHRRLGNSFVCRPLGRIGLKGLSEPLAAYEVTGEQELTLRTQGAPAIGRLRELQILSDAFEACRLGTSTCVQITGEAGIGKSHVVAAFKNQLDSGVPFLEWNCRRHHARKALYPVIEMLRQVLNFYPGQPDEERRDTLAFVLERNGLDPVEGMEALGSLLGLTEATSAETQNPELFRTSTFTLLIKLLGSLAQTPLVLVVEDLHWADPSTLELMRLLIERPVKAQLLIIAVYRNEFSPPWHTDTEERVVLKLGRLSNEEVHKMVDELTGGKPIPRGLLQYIEERTDGVPLFVEEMTRMILESGFLHERDGELEMDGPFPQDAIPATLQDSLMARLDRLESIKEVAQIASVLGREFDYPLIRAVCAVEEPVLQNALTRLVTAEMLYQKGFPPRSSYSFKHALIQETAYQSLLKSTRQHLHHRIAHVLEEQFPEIAEANPDSVAEHYIAAGLTDKAIPLIIKAGVKATREAAMLEAAAHFDRCLSLIAEMAPSEKRDRLELDTLLDGLTAWSAGYGITDDRVRVHIERAGELAASLGADEDLLRVYAGKFAGLFVRDEIESCRVLAAELEVLNARSARPQPFVTHLAEGLIAFGSGRIAESVRILGLGLEQYLPAASANSTGYSHNLGVVGAAYYALALWQSGLADTARDVIAERLRLVREQGTPYDLAFALASSGWIAASRRDTTALRAFGKELRTIAEYHKAPLWLRETSIMLLWADLQEGILTKETIKRLERELERYTAVVGSIAFPTLMGEAALLAGLEGKLEPILKQVLLRMDHNGAYLTRPELLRMLGMIERGRGNSEAAADYFSKSVGYARESGARMWELRALCSWGAMPGRPEDVIGQLQSAYEGIREGHDTPDLMEAQELLRVNSAS